MLEHFPPHNAKFLTISGHQRLLALPLTLVAKASQEPLQRALTATGKEGPDGTPGGCRIGKVKPLQGRFVRLEHALRLRIHKKRDLGGMLEKYPVTRSCLAPIPVVPLKGVLRIEKLLLKLSRSREATGEEQNPSVGQAFREVGHGEIFPLSLRMAELAPARRRGARPGGGQQLLCLT